jgi:hypothetical protein
MPGEKRPRIKKGDRQLILKNNRRLHSPRDDLAKSAIFVAVDSPV